jgi:hypothetical protein
MSIVINTPRPTSAVLSRRGSFEESTLLAKSLEDAEALFWLNPPDPLVAGQAMCVHRRRFHRRAPH